jgi:hypothetical protein
MVFRRKGGRQDQRSKQEGPGPYQLKSPNSLFVGSQFRFTFFHSLRQFLGYEPVDFPCRPTPTDLCWSFE